MQRSSDTGGPLTLVLVDDYEVVIAGLATMLEPYADRVRLVERLPCRTVDAPVDIALFDTHAAELALGPEVKARHRVLYTAQTCEAFVTYARARGASVLPKSLGAEDLVEALERIRHGEIVVHPGALDAEPSIHGSDLAPRLAEREAEVIALITRGLTNEQIACRLYLSINTVKSYIRSAYRKMDVESRSQAVLWGIDHGFARRPARVRGMDLPPWFVEGGTRTAGAWAYVEDRGRALAQTPGSRAV